VQPAEEDRDSEEGKEGSHLLQTSEQLVGEAPIFQGGKEHVGVNEDRSWWGRGRVIKVLAKLLEGEGCLGEARKVDRV
jgi:hypothetical protein